MTIAMLANLLPILLVAFGIVLTLLLIAWQRSQKLILAFTLLVFISALVASISLPVHLNESVQVTPLLKVDGYGNFAFMLVLIASIAVSVLSSTWLNSAAEVHDEYFVLIQLVALGAGILVLSSHFAALFLGFELLSIALVGLAGYGRNCQYSVETSFKYLILSASASSFMLLGIAFIYSQVGSLSFAPAHVNAGYGLFYQAGMLLFLGGVAFKLSLAPFHFWTPDVYQGAPTPVTLLLATVSKVAMFIVLLKYWFSQIEVMSAHHSGEGIQSIISLLAITSMLAGNALALKQQNIKRLLAYSSIAHMGYLLIVLLIISPQSIALAWQSTLFYLSAYVLATISIFSALILTSTKQNSTSMQVIDWHGLFWHRPSLAVLIIIAVLSLAGIPLTMGFIGKFYVLNVAVQAQQWWLIASLVVGSGIGLFYYLTIIFTLFNSEQQGSYEQGLNLPVLKGIHQVSVIGLILLGVFWGVFPDTLSQLFAIQ
ncbi:MAG: NADH-quinone oxidoreductase subunit N [Colwellia sp.]|nr:NADH-quinone oxidoreductase subunit N [Colwellia sp.]MCW9082210.1 NADH-quinone oxidoreductase subunit N [Colwellia sp.]